MCIWRIWGRIDHGGKTDFTGKTLLFLALLLILNGFFFLYQQTGMSGKLRAYGDAYHRQMEEFSGISRTDAADQCQTYRDWATEQMIADPSRSQNPDNLQALRLGQQLQEQYTYLASYESYLKKLMQMPKNSRQ